MGAEGGEAAAQELLDPSRALPPTARAAAAHLRSATGWLSSVRAIVTRFERGQGPKAAALKLVLALVYFGVLHGSPWSDVLPATLLLITGMHNFRTRVNGNGKICLVM